MAQTVAKKQKLSALNLRENELEDRGAMLVAAGLRPLRSLKSVDLSQNQVQENREGLLGGKLMMQRKDSCLGVQIGRSGALAVAKAVKGSSGLQLLGLDENQISETGIEVLKVHFSCSKLQELDCNQGKGPPYLSLMHLPAPSHTLAPASYDCAGRHEVQWTVESSWALGRK